MPSELPDGLTVEHDGAVRIVRLGKPGGVTPIDGAMHEALGWLWRDLATDPDARCIVLTGAGTVFCAGGDFAWIEQLVTDPIAQRRSMAQDQFILRELRACPLPVIAAVNGAAVGLGCSLAIACDLVIMSQDAFLADPHVSIGLVAGDGGAALLPALAPLMRAKQYLFTGDRIPADVAMSLGLTIDVLAPESLMAGTMALAHRIAAQPARALQDTKRAINMHLARAVAGVDDYASSAEHDSMFSPEFAATLERLRSKHR